MINKLLKNGYKKTSLVLIVIAIFLVIFIPQKASAQGISLGIFPPIIQIQATPPTDVKTKLMIQNQGDNPVNLKIGLKPFTASNTENGEVAYDTTYELADPLIFQRMQILDGDTSVEAVTLSPGQKKELTLEIALPQGEPLGDYYFSIVFLSDNSSALNSNVSEAVAGIATNVLLSIGPKGPTQGWVEEFSVPLFVTGGPVPFKVRVKNTGDHFITTKGDIVIKNIFGQNVGKVDLLPVNILAQSIRAIPDSLQSPSANPSAGFKTYLTTLKSTSAVWNEGFLFGPYTATLTIALSDQGPLFRRTVNFFAFPTQTLLIIVAIFIMILIIAIRIKKTSKNP